VPALAAAAVAGEQVARPVKPCNAPATKFSVGRGHTKPGSFTAEAAFCPVGGDSLKDKFPLRGAVRANTVDQQDGGRLGLDDDIALLIIPLANETQSRVDVVG
jgi:hypothetical protein